jgi:hypothetical protein
LVSIYQAKTKSKTTNDKHATMPSSAKQAETTAFDAVHATPFTRVHERPTRKDYEILKKEASTLL